MDITVISLPRAVERRADMTAQFERLGLSFRFFDAVDKLEAPQKHFRRVHRFVHLAELGWLPSPGEIACFASHRAVWQQCVDTDKPVAVFEDDAVLDAQFPAALEASAEVIDELGFIRLEPVSHGRFPEKNQFDIPPVKSVNGFSFFPVTVKRPLRLTGYCITPRVARAYLNASEEMSFPADHLPYKYWLHRCEYFALVPAVVHLSHHADNTSVSDDRVKHSVRHLVAPLGWVWRSRERRRWRRAVTELSRTP